MAGLGPARLPARDAVTCLAYPDLHVRTEEAGVSIGDALALLGLGITMYQLVRTGMMITAIGGAAERTSRQADVYRLLTIVPELAAIERDLDRAIEWGRKAEVSAIVSAWASKVSDLKGLLRSDSFTKLDIEELVRYVGDSLVHATTATRAVKAGKLPLVVATQDFSDACRSVCSAAWTLVAVTRSRPPEQEPRPNVVGQLLAMYWHVRPTDFRRGNIPNAAKATDPAARTPGASKGAET